MKKSTLLIVMAWLFFAVVPCMAQAQTSASGPVEVSGSVFGTDDAPLSGVIVTVKGTTIGTATDSEGRFSLSTTTDAVLQFSFMGYVPVEESVAGRNVIEISMEQDAQAIENVVVIGYGTLDKREVTSAVSHISSRDFLSSSATDPMMMIQGKVSGVSVSNTAMGDPNSLASIQIRGVSSRSAGLGPLIVIDGVPGADITNVNPNDIESMDILKDGAASAIYGTAGSNGVIIVTTKKGSRDGQVRTSYIGSVTGNFVLNELDMLTADEYRTHFPGETDFGGNTDWFREITRNGLTHQHTVSISGGNHRTNYRGSVDYRNAEGVDLRSFREEYGGRVSLNHQTRSGLFDFAVNIAPRVIYNSVISPDSFKMAMEMNPTRPVYNQNVTDENPWEYSYTGTTGSWNPVEELRLEQDGNEIKILDWNASVTANLLPLLAPASGGHTLTSRLSFADQQSDTFHHFFIPKTSTRISKDDPGRYDDMDNKGSRSYEKSRHHTLEWVNNYTFHSGGHQLRAMAGYSYQYFQKSNFSAENGNFASDALSYNSLGSGTWAIQEGKNGMASFKEDSKLIAFFGRLHYDWEGRYIVTASLRYEGSSRFGTNNKWGYFPAFSAGWRISEEPFMQSVGWINELKLRADYGETGNQNFANYLSLSRMVAVSQWEMIDYHGDAIYTWGKDGNPNPNLKWEKAKNWNIGLDFSLLDNRVYGSINYYHRTQQDLLGNYNVPSPPNVSSTTFVNVGTMRNNGLEIDLNWDAVKNKNFGYSINFAGATNGNKFLSFSNSEYTGEKFYELVGMEGPNTPGNLQLIEEGQRIGNYFTHKYAGIDESGNWVFHNADGTEMLTASEVAPSDRRITGNALPKFTASMTHTFRYKKLDLTLYFRGVFGYDLFNVHEFYYGLPQSIRSNIDNVLTTAIGKNAPITKGSNVLSDYFIERGDHVKLDMVNIGYRFDVNNKWLDGVRVSVTGRNLFTMTKFSGIDPSAYSVNGLTPGLAYGGDFGSRRYYPSTRQVIFSVQLDF